MKYGNIYKVLIMAVLAAIILSLSMRLFKNPEESKEPIVQPETAAELTEEDITAETERNQTTMATYPDEVEAEARMPFTIRKASGCLPAENMCCVKSLL